MRTTQYKFHFECHDNGMKHQAFMVSAASKDEAIQKALKKALKAAAGDITSWQCQFMMGL